MCLPGPPPCHACQAWRRRGAELRCAWNVAGFEQEQEYRMQYQGRTVLNALTGKYEIIYPTWGRMLT